MKIAIIGTGYIAGRHAAVLAEHKNITIAAHVDVLPEGAKAAAEKWGGNAYTSVDDMLANEKIDAAWVCVPPFAHGAVEIALLQNGVPMYIEKPVETGLHTARTIAAKIKETGVLVNVGYYLRCAEATAKVQSMLQETPPRMVRIAYHGPTPPALWWQQKERSGGQVVEQATHLIDIARVLLGEPKILFATSSHHKRAAYPQLDVATATLATLQFAPDVLAQFTATCVLDNTTDASLEFNCDGRKITYGRFNVSVETADGVATESIGTDPLAIADRLFIEAVQTGDATKLPCPYDEAVRTQELCLELTKKSEQ